jgi:hypothetical protein
VKKPIARRVAVIGATAVSMTVFGGGVAMADDPLAGKTYADASAQIDGWSATAVIATVVGGRLPTDECIVSHWQKDTNDKSRIMVSLNCNAGVASANAAGNSVTSPEGRAAKHEKDMEYWRSSVPDGQAWCTENVDKHPDWAAVGLFQGCSNYNE